MKKNLYLILLLLTINVSKGLCAIFTIGNIGFAFNPTTLPINLGDTVVFSLNSIHNAREVDQNDWNNNTGVWNGGFQTAFGGDTVFLDQVKVYYYVCANHFSTNHMKGTITVSDATGIKPVANATPHLEVFPNPASKEIIIKTNFPGKNEVTVKINNLLGNCLYERKNVLPIELLDIEGIPSGIYFVEVRSENARFQKKLIVSR